MVEQFLGWLLHREFGFHDVSRAILLSSEKNSETGDEILWLSFVCALCTGTFRSGAWFKASDVPGNSRVSSCLRLFEFFWISVASPVNLGQNPPPPPSY